MPNIAIIGTCDTKLQELLYLRSRILEASSDAKVILVDAGRSPTKHADITVTQEELTSRYAPKESQDVSTLPRGQVITYMLACATDWLQETYSRGVEGNGETLHGIISAGGTGGTSLASGVMRAVLPLGFPKLIVSTNASADVSPIVGETDITMMPSIVDIAGSNELLQRILDNAAGAIVGMAQRYEKSLQVRASGLSGQAQQRKRRVGLTMFGVTTPCCDRIRTYLENNYTIEVFVFHCTGAGGKAMERLVREGGLDAVCDITTTEICDHVAGGVMSAGPNRLAAPLQAGIPHLISVGATDMVNFGPRASVPEKYQQRKLFEHNPTVTLMRTNAAECTAIGNFIVDVIKTHAVDLSNVQIILPMGGVSIIATPDGPFHDAEADQALFSTITKGLEGTAVEVVQDERAINDEALATDMAKRLVKMMKL